MIAIPFGFDSALAHAKSLKPHSNMGISAALVIELAGCIEQMQARIAEFEQANNRVILDSSAPKTALVAVDAGALDQLRVTVEAYGKAWSGDMPQRKKIAALQMAEAARRLLAGG